MKNIAVAGTGYVGLSTGTCFADMGNKVTCIDINEEKIEMLRRGEVPIYEPGLSEMIVRNVRAGRLRFTTDYEEALSDAEFVFICVGTPSGVDGEADLQYVRMAAESVAKTMTHPLIVINKSTVPVGTGDWVADIITRNQPEPIDFAVVSCPEFTREGSAIYDFMNPDRVVLGSHDQEAAEKVAQLHLPLRTRIVMTDLRTAEMIKYASNAFLATKISFINEIAAICERLGADVEEVAVGMGYDKRIGPHFLSAGLGYGGSCFPKDVKALEHMALVHGSHPSLLRAVMEINRDARRWAILNLRDSWAARWIRSGSACWDWPSSPTPTTSASRRRWRSPACCRTKVRWSAATIRWPWSVQPRSIPNCTWPRIPTNWPRCRRPAGLHRVERVQAARSGPGSRGHGTAHHGRRPQHLRCRGNETARLHLPGCRQRRHL